MEGTRPLVLLLLAACGTLLAGCSKTCEGSSLGALEIVNDAPGEGPLIVRVSVFEDQLLPIVTKDDVLFPGEAVRFNLVADHYTVVISWDGGSTATYDVEVEPTPDGYALDLGWFFDDEDEDPEDDWLDQPELLPDCPLKVTELKVTPP